MCGILGRIHRQASSTDTAWPELPPEIISTLAHRGPDSSGVLSDAHIQFGHTRLSIIDLTNAGHQPMLSHNNRYVVTYNGEIYNYPELREALKQLPRNIPVGYKTPQPLAMKANPECINYNDIVGSYRKFYQTKQERFKMAWTKRPIPEWFAVAA